MYELHDLQVAAANAAIKLHDTAEQFIHRSVWKAHTSTVLYCHVYTNGETIEFNVSFHPDTANIDHYWLATEEVVMAAEVKPLDDRLKERLDEVKARRGEEKSESHRAYEYLANAVTEEASRLKTRLCNLLDGEVVVKSHNVSGNIKVCMENPRVARDSEYTMPSRATIDVSLKAAGVRPPFGTLWAATVQVDADGTVSYGPAEDLGDDNPFTDQDGAVEDAVKLVCTMVCPS